MIVVDVDGSASSVAAVDWVVTEALLRHREISPSRAGVIGPFATARGDGATDDTFTNHVEQALAEALRGLDDQGKPVTERVALGALTTTMLLPPRRYEDEFDLLRLGLLSCRERKGRIETLGLASLCGRGPHCCRLIA